jgi:hypothetical protein
VKKRQGTSFAPPATLLTLGIPAYGQSLSMDDEAIYLLTGTAICRILPGHNQLEMLLGLGIGAALTS